MPADVAAPVEVCISYSHKDYRLREKLETHFSLLKRQGVIDAWHDRRITAGREWASAIDEHLDRAALILLLVSADFLASDYCYDREMTRALERHDAGDARVIPIILRPVDWHNAPFARLEALPRDGKAVTDWSSRDRAFKDIAEGIRRAVAEIRAHRPVAKLISDLDAFHDVDAPWCPEMVALPLGEFLMGSLKDEVGRFSDEGPQHRVRIGYRLGLGRYLVTVAEYRRYADGYRALFMLLLL